MDESVHSGAAVIRERAAYERMWQQDDYSTFSPEAHAVENLDLVKQFRMFGARGSSHGPCLLSHPEAPLSTVGIELFPFRHQSCRFSADNLAIAGHLS